MSGHLNNMDKWSPDKWGFIIYLCLRVTFIIILTKVIFSVQQCQFLHWSLPSNELFSLNDLHLEWYLWLVLIFTHICLAMTFTYIDLEQQWTLQIITFIHEFHICTSHSMTFKHKINAFTNRDILLVTSVGLRQYISVFDVIALLGLI